MKGTIYSWNNDKGYGFIQVENSQRRVFAHITEFNQKHPTPQIGEEVSFDLYANQEKDGKFAAKKIHYLNRKPTQFSNKTSHYQRKEQYQSIEEDATLSVSTIIAALMSAVIFGLLAYKGYQILAAYWWTPKKPNLNTIQIQKNDPELTEPQFNDNYQDYQQPKTFKPARNLETVQPKTPKYQCDGRIYCSQMTSCEEATWFLRNCQDTKMDGNHDGVPCESQWCGR